MTSRTILLVAGLAGAGALYCAGDSAGAARERGKVVQARVDTLTREVRRTDTLWRQAKAQSAKQDTVWQTVRVTDTIAVPVPGKPESVTVYVPRAAADSTIQACRRLVFACDARIAASDSLVRALRVQVDFERDRHPGFISTWAWRLGAFGVGYVAGR